MSSEPRRPAARRPSAREGLGEGLRRNLRLGFRQSLRPGFREGLFGGRPATPGLLEPFLARYERLDRRRLRIRQVRQEGILGVRFRTHGGAPVHLADGSTVAPGDLVGELHLNNERLRAVIQASGEPAAWALLREDLRALARWARNVPPERRPVAYYGESIIAPLARRVGFEVRQRPSTAWTRLQDWYLRGVLARWSVEGRRRLREGRGPLRAGVAWLSHAALQRRHGVAPGGGPPGGGRPGGAPPDGAAPPSPAVPRS
jgi:hypothetical protein